MEPIFAKMKKGAQITDDWQFNPDGTGSYCLTREKPFSIRWKIVRKSGATWFLELNMNPEDKSPVKIVFKGPDRFAMIWLDEGESEEIPPGTYHRIR